MKAYQELETRFGRLMRIYGAVQMLQWDAAAMMPAGGAQARSEQLATLKVVAHEMLTADDMEDLLDAAAGEELDTWQRANLVEMRRQWIHSTAVEARLVDALSRKGSACEMMWRQARKDDDFASLAPYLSDVMALVREVAAAKSDALGCSPYDALLDEYEPGGKSAHIDEIFDDLAGFLPGFLERVLEHQASKGSYPTPEGPFPVDVQRKVGADFMRIVGFDFDHGRIDTSHHPFCGGVAADVRITTRYTTDNFGQSFMAVLHETGHALYEQGLPTKWHYQPVGNARGMSVHEGQSLLMEMQVGRSREFINFAAPLLREAFGGSGEAWNADNLYRMFIRVEPGLIRVNADEVTYPAHVILRYRLEKAMLAGDLEVADLPQAWREGMEEMIGITPPDDRDGCMQDIHWMDGAVGYFPTYTLGAMTAAQVFDAARRAQPEIVTAIAKGEFTPLLTWLRANVHGKASLLPTDELLTQATGRPLTATVYKEHLKRRYLS